MPKGAFEGPLEKIGPHCWRIPKSYKPRMRVDGVIFADDEMIDQIRADQAPEQVANVACICRVSSAPASPCRTSTGDTASALAASARPIRRTTASSHPAGWATTSTAACARAHQSDAGRPANQIEPLVDSLFGTHPGRVGRERPLPLPRQGDEGPAERRPAFLKKKGLATDGDLDCTEARGRLDDADIGVAVSDKALSEARTSAARLVRATTSSKCR
jgi:tRNA-splicing ligase RtcB